MTTAFLLLDAQINLFALDFPVYGSATLFERLADLIRRVRSAGIAGMQSELCSDATCRAAVDHGYAVTLLADAHSTCDSDGESAAEIHARSNRELLPLVMIIAAQELIFS